MKHEDVALLESLLRNVLHALTPVLRDAELALEILAARKLRGSPARRGNGILRDLIDDGRFAVRWNGSECYLGSSLPFRLLRRLAVSANRYVSIEQLLDDVWGGPRSTAAVRSAVRALRRRLEAADMADLARAIDGQPGHYGLRMDRIERPPLSH